MDVAGCSGLDVVWGLSVISDSVCSEVSTPCCSVVGGWGLAEVVIGFDVIGSCGLVAETSGFEVFRVTVVVGVCVSQSVAAAVVAVVLVVKVVVDGACGFDEVDFCGCVTVELIAVGSLIGSEVAVAGVVGLSRSVTTFHNQVNCIHFQL